MGVLKSPLSLQPLLVVLGGRPASRSRPNNDPPFLFDRRGWRRMDKKRCDVCPGQISLLHVDRRKRQDVSFTSHRCQPGQQLVGNRQPGWIPASSTPTNRMPAIFRSGRSLANARGLLRRVCTSRSRTVSVRPSRLRCGQEGLQVARRSCSVWNSHRAGHIRAGNVGRTGSFRADAYRVSKPPPVGGDR